MYTAGRLAAAKGTPAAWCMCSGSIHSCMLLQQLRAQLHDQQLCAYLHDRWQLRVKLHEQQLRAQRHGKRLYTA